MPAISIVIPVYNAQSYIHRFVGALQAQSFGDFEALFVDDASTDQSTRILEDLGSGDSRLKLLRHPHNLGAGAARNTAIRAACGETLCFADPDDMLPPNSLEARYTAFKKHNAVVRACHIEIGVQGHILSHEKRPENLPLLFNPSDAASQVGVNPFLCAHCTWLFPTKMLQRMRIFNEENIRTAEDIIFLTRLYHNIRQMIWIEDVVYHWVKRDDSLSNTFYSRNHYFDYFKCVDIFYEESLKRKKTILADVFCNDYLTCYILHLLLQIHHGKSTEDDALAVIGEMTRICAKHGAMTRCFPKIQGNILANAGFFLLWIALNDESPTMTERLMKGRYALARQHQLSMSRP